MIWTLFCPIVGITSHTRNFNYQDLLTRVLYWQNNAHDKASIGDVVYLLWVALVC